MHPPSTYSLTKPKEWRACVCVIVSLNDPWNNQLNCHQHHYDRNCIHYFGYGNILQFIVKLIREDIIRLRCKAERELLNRAPPSIRPSFRSSVSKQPCLRNILEIFLKISSGNFVLLKALDVFDYGNRTSLDIRMMVPNVPRFGRNCTCTVTNKMSRLGIIHGVTE